MSDDMREVRASLLKSFPNSVINNKDEFIAHIYSNQYIILSNCETPEDVECKVLEWFSRPAHKTIPYSQGWRNRRFHQFMLDGVNAFLDSRFTEEDMSYIYGYLGNAIRHSSTQEFIRRGMDMGWLKEQINSGGSDGESAS